MADHNAGFRNIDIQDQGVRWTVSYEWKNDDNEGIWETFTAQFPRDFNELKVDEVTPIMHQLAAEVARATDTHD